jgi:hypothetical protein
MIRCELPHSWIKEHYAACRDGSSESGLELAELGVAVAALELRAA